MATLKKTVAYRFSEQTIADLSYLHEVTRLSRNGIIESLIAEEARRVRQKLALEAAQLEALTTPRKRR